MGIEGTSRGSSATGAGSSWISCECRATSGSRNSGRDSGCVTNGDGWNDGWLSRLGLRKAEEMEDDVAGSLSVSVGSATRPENIEGAITDSVWCVLEMAEASPTFAGFGVLLGAVSLSVVGGD